MMAVWMPMYFKHTFLDAQLKIRLQFAVVGKTFVYPMGIYSANYQGYCNRFRMGQSGYS